MAVSVWGHPSALTMVRELWIEGVPVREIARRISAKQSLTVTHCAVIGKVHRLGLAKEFPRSVGGDRETQAQSSKLACRAKSAKRPAKGTPYKPEPILADVTNARPWLTREKGECAFPLGERGAILSCCAPTEGTYCPAHRQAMGGVQKPARDLERMARAA